MGETSAEVEQTFTVTVPSADLGLTSFDAHGVYRVQAVLQASANERPDGDDPEPGETLDPALDGQHTLTASTPFVWGGAGEVSAVPISTIVPLLLPSDSFAMPSTDQLGDVIPRFAETLQAAERAGSTLAIDPRIIAGIRAYGTEAPASARDFLADLEASSAPSFLLQFADADPAAQAALGFDELLAPTGLEYVTRDGNFPVEDAEAPTDADAATSDTGEPTPTPTDAPSSTNAPESTDAPDPEEPAVPTLDELLAWPGSDLTAWPTPGEVDAATLELLQDDGYDTLVLDAVSVDGAVAPRMRIGEMNAVVGDSRLGAAVGQALGAPSEVESSGGLASAIAELVLAAQNDSTGMVIAFDRGAVTDSESTARVLDDLTDLDWVTPIPVAMQGESDGEGELRAGSGVESRIEHLRAAVKREADVVALSPLLEHPEYLSSYQRARLLGLFATRFASAESGFEATADRFRSRDAELAEGVQVLRSTHTQLVSTSSRVPVQVHNSLPFDAVITGEVRPASAALRVTVREIEATAIPAGGNQNLLIPVHTRVSSGSSGLTVTLTDASGETEFATETIPISINSAVERIALAVLGVLAATLLGFGVWRSVRRRRSGLTADADEPDTASGISEP